ncbi:hypothetical protein OIU74_006957 [Salix koriyanagi]|uniref:Uncharacterized protein n=1 Tax=Salix koriyanagi TaxID=2511006 RepID=A0A9Q0U2K5_9ROSI|nr:hypothetical protein OIU74_006957 [Salix koriyanagi]
MMSSSQKQTCPFRGSISLECPKVTHQEVRPVDTWHFRLKLPPPPSASKSTRFPSDDNLQALSTPSSSFKKGLTRDGKADRRRPKTVRKNAGSSLSCKYSCPVAGDNLVRMSQFSTPISKKRGNWKGTIAGQAVC